MYGSTSDELQRVVASDDGGFFATGYSFLVAGTWLMKFDADGELVWNKGFEEVGGLRDFPRAAVAVPGGGVVLAGYDVDYNTFVYRSIITRVAADGSVVWTRAYTGCTPGAIDVTADGGFVMLGTSQTGGLLVMRLDQSGSPIWQQNYGAVGASTVRHTADGGFILAGGGPAGTEFRILKLDGNGSVQWQRVFQGSAHPNGLGVTGIAPARDCGFAIAVWDNDDMLILRFDDLGNILWQNRIGTATVSERAEGITATRDGGFVIVGERAGYVSAVDYRSTYAFVKLRDDGTIAWQREFDRGPVSYGEPNAVTQLANGDLVAVGLTDTINRDNILHGYVVKVSEAGDFGAACGYSSPLSLVSQPWNAMPSSVPPVTATPQSYPPDSSVTFNSSDLTMTMEEDCHGEGPDAREDDEGCVRTGWVDAGVPQTRNFYDDTEDWVGFHGRPGQTDIATVTPIGASVNATLEIYDTDCATLLAAGTGSVSFTVPSLGTYHLRVVQSGPVGNDTAYTLSLSGDTHESHAWSRAYGSASDDDAVGAVPTSRGGFAVVGRTTLGDPSGSGLVFTVGPDGALGQQRRHGATVAADRFEALEQTAGSGFVAAGGTTGFGAAGEDVWVALLSGINLTASTRARFGGPGNERAESVRPTADGGYMVLAETTSYGDLDGDLWLVKLTPTLTIQYQRAIGGADVERAGAVLEVSGGYLIVGTTRSFGAGGDDAWVVRTDAQLNVLWQHTLGGAQDDAGLGVATTRDGGYVMAASTRSFGAGQSDAWMVKLDATGNVLWNKTYGGPLDEAFQSIQETRDGGLIVAGYTDDFGLGGRDGWVLRLDAGGAAVWEKTYGSLGTDSLRSIRELADGGFASGGTSDSFGLGGRDAWMVKLSSTGDAGDAVNPCPQTTTSSATIGSPLLLAGCSAANVTTTNATSNTGIAGTSSSIILSSPGTGGCYGNLKMAPPEVSASGASEPLVWVDATTLVWEPASNSGAERFDVYRGTVAGLATGNYGNCFKPNLTINTTVDLARPPAGTAWTYLVTGENAFGEGPLGADSAGQPRVNSYSCP